MGKSPDDFDFRHITIVVLVAKALCSLNERSKPQKRSRTLSPIRSPNRERLEEKILKDERELNDFLKRCQKRKRPKLIQTAPSVASRVGIPFYRSSGTVFSSESKPKSLALTHDAARVEMALNHRASHERLRDGIFASADRIMNIVSAHGDMQGMSKREVLKYVDNSLESEMNRHKETLVSVTISVQYR